MYRTLLIATLIVVAVAYGQVQGGGRGAPQGAPPAGAGRGGLPPLGATPKPMIANAKPSRSCESLAMVALPNATIESAAVDPKDPAICRVTAVTTHPPAGDKVKHMSAIGSSRWSSMALYSRRITRIWPASATVAGSDHLAPVGRPANLRGRDGGLLHARSGKNGRREEGFGISTAVHGARRGPLRRKHGTDSFRTIGRAGFLGGRRQGACNIAGGSSRSGGDNYPIATAVPVSAGGQV